MFKHHTIFTRIAYLLVAAGCILSLVSTAFLLSRLSPDQSVSFTWVLALLIVLIINLVLAWCIFKRSWRALILAILFYAVQVPGVVAAGNSWVLDFGASIRIGWPVGGAQLSVNLIAALILIALVLAYFSVKRQQLQAIDPGSSPG